MKIIIQQDGPEAVITPSRLQRLAERKEDFQQDAERLIKELEYLQNESESCQLDTIHYPGAIRELRKAIEKIV